MSKKHFIELADCLTQAHSEFVVKHGQQAYDDMVDIACRFCRSQNHHFLEGRFRGYIAGENGPNGGAVKKAKAG